MQPARILSSIVCSEVCLLLETPTPARTAIFYKSLNEFLSTCEGNSTVPLHQQRVKIVFTPSEMPSTGFAFITNETPTVRTSDTEGRPIHLYSECDNSLQTIVLTSYMMVILRNPSIEMTKDFYSTYGVSIEEQHETGPRHYSISWNGIFTEIYPERKIKGDLTEIFCQIGDTRTAATWLAEKGFTLSSFDHPQVTDPDGRVIKFIS